MKKRKQKKLNPKRKAAKGADTKDNGTVADLVGEVWSVMSEQAEKNRSLKMLHARLEPEWNKVSQKINDLLAARNEDALFECVDDICGYGAKAVRPLIDVLLKLRKEMASKR